MGWVSRNMEHNNQNPACKKYPPEDQFVILPHKNVLKPHLTPEHEVACVFYAWSRLNLDLGVYDSFHQDVHIDKKWWFMTEQDYKCYLPVRETPPKCSRSNKNNIVKVMMLSALARPRFNAQGVCSFDGKIGIWAFVDTHKAKRTTKLHNKDDKYLVPKPKITRNIETC